MIIFIVFLGILFIFLVFIGMLLISDDVWMMLSRQKRDPLWIQLAGEIGAEFIKGGSFREIGAPFIKGGSFPSSKVQAHFKEWTITLDTHMVTSGSSSRLYTRIKAPFENTNGLQFTLFPKSLVDKLVSALEASVIETGDAEFDHNFIIRGNDELKIQAVFANPRIRQLIEGLRYLGLVIKNNELISEAQGEIKDVERLKSLFELFKVMLDQLKG